MKNILVVVYFFYITFSSSIYANIDLEAVSQDFILKTVKIDIPGYPKAFNPSIIRWKGSLLLSFREIPDPKAMFNSNIGLIWLDEKFKPVGEPYLLETRSPENAIPSRSEDARLIEVYGHLYIVYSDNIDLKITRGGFRVFIGEIKFDGNKFSLHDIERLSIYEGESQLIREKNWVPFVYDHDLLLAYSLNSHKIFRPILGTGECETIADSKGLFDWDWGDLRGGTPGISLNDDEYLAFFHCSKDIPTLHSEGKTISHYFMGGYTFSKQPPFEIKRISPNPIVAKGFYTGTVYKPYWKQVRAIFPCGLLVEGDFVWVAYGRADYECWMIKLDKKIFLNSLKPVICE